MRVSVLFFFLLGCAELILTTFPFCLCGQETEHYLIIYFTTKQGTPYSINKPADFLTQRSVERRQKYNIAIDSSDLPVNPNLTDSLFYYGIADKLCYTSRWMNAAVVTPSAGWQLHIDKPWIKKVLESVVTPSKKTLCLPKISLAEEIMKDSVTANSLVQLKISRLHENGLKGNGVRIAVLDAGFQYIERHRIFDLLFQNNGVVATRDFVKQTNDVYDYHPHGKNVMGFLAADLPGYSTGAAPNAEYILVRTDDAGSEPLLEQYHWMAGAEFADSLGADIITASLNYYGFSDLNSNYTVDDLDGKTAVVSQAAGMATGKGVVVVVSAGNEGASLRQYIGFPADHPDVLAVGAVDELGNRCYSADYASSVGTKRHGIVKPDVMARGFNVFIPSNSPLSQGEFVRSSGGTSYAAPLIAGGIACLIQQHPVKTPLEIIDAVRRSGHNSMSPDTLFGWGIPDFFAASQFLAGFEFKNEDILITSCYYSNATKSIEIELMSRYAINPYIEMYDVSGRLLVQKQVSIPYMQAKKVSVLLYGEMFPNITVLTIRDKNKRILTKKIAVY